MTGRFSYARTHRLFFCFARAHAPLCSLFLADDRSSFSSTLSFVLSFFPRRDPPQIQVAFLLLPHRSRLRSSRHRAVRDVTSLVRSSCQNRSRGFLAHNGNGSRWPLGGWAMSPSSDKPSQSVRLQKHTRRRLRGYQGAGKNVTYAATAADVAAWASRVAGAGSVERKRPRGCRTPSGFRGEAAGGVALTTQGMTRRQYTAEKKRCQVISLEIVGSNETVRNETDGTVNFAARGPCARKRFGVTGTDRRTSSCRCWPQTQTEKGESSESTTSDRTRFWSF